MLSPSALVLARLSLITAAAPAGAPVLQPTGMNAESVELRRQLATERKLILTGGVIGGAGLVTTTLGFSVLAGIHVGNWGPGMTIAHTDPAEAKRIVRTANTMTAVGVVGVSLLLTGVVFAVIGGTTRQRASRRGLSRGVVRASPGSFALRF